jgi:hypothetical protein
MPAVAAGLLVVHLDWAGSSA